MTSAEFQDKNRDYAHTNDRTVVIKELENGVRLFVDLSDHVIGLNIVRGHYETDEVRYLRRVLKPGDTAIDAGAHIGFFTMQMAAIVGAGGVVTPSNRSTRTRTCSSDRSTRTGSRIASSSAVPLSARPPERRR